MHIAINADPLQKEAILQKGIPAKVDISWMQTGMEIPAADAYFDFSETHSLFSIIKDKPVFVNEVLLTGNQLPHNCIRVNAWSSFLERPLLEIAAAYTNSEAANILQTLEWKYQWTPDEPGFIAARMVAMIINEAYFALEQQVSSKKEIDTAMKLGTNYPMGPFEWAEKIGLRRIYHLLKTLEKEDKRYKAAGLLEKEALQP
jgi:3-hydroxybutyryl-CoA dehydrogenase